MAWYYAFRTTHPSYLPILGTLSLLAVAGAVLLLGSVARLFRGPDRTRTLGWLLIGITPLMLAAAHLGCGALDSVSRPRVNESAHQVNGRNGNQRGRCGR